MSVPVSSVSGPLKRMKDKLPGLPRVKPEAYLLTAKLLVKPIVLVVLAVVPTKLSEYGWMVTKPSVLTFRFELLI